ncbi:VOC family protein [Massilia arenosa]|uniref:VOC family protein n=1 Tax=Zemynaea arenosa TaxID=2561931 RepID=A0A4Y9SJ70_9BURK|nr:VOC family protein [Massilia arenosa]TFW25468.1 VOC family protein [Massilia arenosa]
MLSDKDAVAMLAVKDVAAAARFYEGVLGFERQATLGDMVAVYRSGGTRFNVYKSEYAGTNRATAMVWSVGAPEEVEKIAADLKARGVRFEHYDLPALTREGDVYSAAGMKTAWFKDPDGNVLSIVSG